VAFSGVSGAKDEALKRGAQRFETKPVGPDELLRIVADMFTPDGAAWARPANAVSERRIATRALGEATLSKFIIETPDFFDKLRLTTRILARFFGQFSAVSKVVAPMRFATKRSNSGWIVRSLVATMYQLGLDLHAVPSTFCLNKSATGAA
jgi:hypothetical protein